MVRHFGAKKLFVENSEYQGANREDQGK